MKISFEQLRQRKVFVQESNFSVGADEEGGGGEGDRAEAATGAAGRVPGADVPDFACQGGEGDVDFEIDEHAASVG